VNFKRDFPHKMLQSHTSSRKSFPTKSTSATGAAALAAGFIISIMTRNYFIAAIVNRNSRL
jgi:hypothetical protein